ncbi:P-loop ATPase, Sll1717 family [Bradyrhizobium sp. USDA 4353]
MPRLFSALGLIANPFEHYVAETEPDIVEYAVKPPYFEAIDARAKNTSSYILFGDRGAGKSATRLTVFKELWAAKAKRDDVPLAVNFVDFSVALSGKRIGAATESILISEVAFVVIESLLVWLSSLEEDDRNTYQEAMNAEELGLCYELLRDHYLSRPSGKREKSSREAMELFNQAFVSKSRLWVEQRWTAVTSVVAKTLQSIIELKTGVKADVGDDLSGLLKKADDEYDSILLIRKLVDLVKVFGFAGIVLLIDKVDETEATTNSADKTAELIYPLLARVQLLEIKGFSWIFFLWSRIKGIFEAQQFAVRLDKIGHATVSWEDQFFVQMLNRRLEYYSRQRVGGSIGFAGLFEANTNMPKVYSELISVSMRSPRELVRLMDVIVREHDIRFSEARDVVLLSAESMQIGLDKYVTDTIATVYGERLLAQIFRLNKTVFTNKDVQLTFKVGAQSARTRIQSWENAGIIRLTGTRAAEGAQGGKPANEYTVVDARVERVMLFQLISYDDNVEPEDGFNAADE